MGTELITYREEHCTPFELGNRIGAGPNVVVQMAKARGSKTWAYARKTITLDENTLDEDTLESIKRSFMQEVKTLREAQHYHVITFVDAFSIGGESPSLALVMNRASGSIQDFVTAKRRKRSDLDRIQQWFGCLVNVVDYIHGIGIRHRDIKPANILVHEKKVRLADFGISQMGLGLTLSTTIPEWARGRTPEYCAPEVDQESSRGRSADIFSLGAVFLEMLVAHSYLDQLKGLREKLKFGKGGSYAKRLADIHTWIQEFEKDIMRTPEDDWRRQILSLCQKMLHEDRDERPKASQLKEALSLLPNSALPPCSCVSIESMASDAKLVEACKNGDQGSVQSLVCNGASAETIGAIHQASARGHADIVQDLVNSRVDINLVDHSYQTALHCAAGNQQEMVVDFLLSQGATVTLQDAEKRTPLHYAAGSGSTSIVCKLLDRSEALFDIRDQNGQTAFHFAAKRGHKYVVQRLLMGTDPRLTDNKGRTALHFAAGYGSEDVVKMLLRTIDPNAEDADESTALHFAAKGKQSRGKYAEVIKMLLDGGADPKRADSTLLNPAVLARRNKTPGWELLRDAYEEALRKEALCKKPEGSTGDSQITVRGNEKRKPWSANILDEFHPDLVSFMTLAQYHKVDIWPISWDPKLSKLGKGATGDVMQSMVNLEAQFAFKRFVSHRGKQPKIDSSGYSDTVFQDNDKLFRALMSELVILSQPKIKRHPHIVDIEGIAFDVESTTSNSSEAWPVLVMKKAHHGSLQSYMNHPSGKATDTSTRLRLCGQIGSAISTMHSDEVVHGDVKPANVLVYTIGESVCAQVTDFSYSCLGKHEDDVVHVPKSEPWNAPEHRRSEVRIGDAKLVDIYSFGMVCLWLLFPRIFHEFVEARREHRHNENGPRGTERIAEKLASDESSLSPSSREALTTFFSSTLCEDPEERTRDWGRLIELLGQTTWQPQAGQRLFDGTRRLTLADYHATKDDVEDPVKLQNLTKMILNSLHLTGKDYDVMRDHLDSTKFDETQRTEWYINKVLEGLSLFSVPAPEKDEEMQRNLAHDCVNIGPAFSQLVLLDYRVRVHIAACLQERGDGPCQHCALSAAAELALWYTLGFGVHSDIGEAQMWLAKSDITDDQLHQRLDGLKAMTIAEFEITTHSKSGSSGLFGMNLHNRYSSGNFESATAHINREVHDLEQHLGSNHWLIFELRMELAELLSEQGSHDEAQNLLEEMRKSLRERYGSENPYVVRAELHLADHYKRQYLWEQAENLLEGVKITLVNNLGLQHQMTIQACLELASVYAERGKSQEAKKEFHLLHTIIKETLHADHPFAGRFKERYANLLEKDGNIEDANRLRSQHASEGNTSKELSLLIDEHNEGRNARLTGHLDVAERLLLKVKADAEKLAERQGKPEQSRFATRAALVATQNLALVYRDQKHFKKSERLQRTLKDNVETELGHHDPVTLDVTYDLARTLEIQEEWVEAEKLQLEVKEGRSAVLGSQHERTLLASQRLATIYDMQGRPDDAENEMEEVKDACVQRLGPDHPETLEVTVALGKMYLLHGKLESADENFSVAVSISQNVLGLHAEQTLGSMSDLGLVYFLQGRLEEAEELLKQTREDMLKHLGHGHKFTKITEGHLSCVYQQQGKFQEMSGLREHDQPLIRHDIPLRPLTEDEQIQIALQQSIQTQFRPSEDMDDSSDDDLKKAIEMSLEKEEEEPSVEKDDEAQKNTSEE